MACQIERQSTALTIFPCPPQYALPYGFNASISAKKSGFYQMILELTYQLDSKTALVCINVNDELCRPVAIDGGAGAQDGYISDRAAKVKKNTDMELVMILDS